jgi:RNA polymerase sigma-70 factor (ECF subfamily)
MEPIDREILALRHFEELSNHDVALVLGMTPAAASSRFLRALKKLKQLLSTYSGMNGP